MRMLAVIPVILLPGCSITLPFNYRLSYANLNSAKGMRSNSGAVQVLWEPGSFPERIDNQGASGFVGRASQSKIPTGVALATRITEALDAAVGVGPDAGKKLTIRVINAKSKFEYSASIFNVTPVMDYGACTFEAEFKVGSQSWVRTFEATSKDSSIGGQSATGVLERVWDDIALQVCRDVLKHLQEETAVPAK